MRTVPPARHGVRRWLVLCLVLMLSAFGTVTVTGSAAAGQVRFLTPSEGDLHGLTDVEVSAPAETTSVRFSMDGTAFAEVTNVYTRATGQPSRWRTSTDARWFAAGQHVLRADVSWPGGGTTVEMRVTTHRSSTPANVTDLDGSWSFAPESELPPGSLEGSEPPAAGPGFDESGMTSVLVPSSFGAVRDRWNKHQGQRVLYRRTVALDTSPAGQRTSLVAQSCYFACDYFVNGRKVGASQGGYLPVRLDVTGALHPGRNVLAVVVDNRLSEIKKVGIDTGLYWHWGGLLQEVRLERTPAAAVTGLTASGDAAGLLRVRADTVNPTGKERHAPVRITVRDPEGRLVLERPATVAMPAGGGESSPVTLEVPHPRLWRLDNPALYRVEMTVTGHRFSTSTGFRDVRVRGSSLLLNGKPLTHLRGINRHADYPGLGRTIPDGLAYRSLFRLHHAGFRIIRAGHYPTTPALLDAADRLGMLVVEEVNVHQATPEQLASRRVRDFARQQLDGMIARDRGHPSIAVWSVGNENETQTPKGADYVRDLVGYGRQRDPSRLYTEVSAWHEDDKSYRYQDIVMSNVYAGWYYGRTDQIDDYLDRTQRAAGGKPIVLSEWGAEAVRNRPGFGKGTEFYQSRMVGEYTRQLSRRPATVGWMYWPATEFWVSPTWTGGNPEPTPPFHTKALLDWFGRPKQAWKALFSPVYVRALPPVLTTNDGKVHTVVPLRVDNIANRTASGRLVLSPPPGVHAHPDTRPFTVGPGETRTVHVRLSGRVDPGAAIGTVRAVLDDGTQSGMQALSFEPSGAGTALALDAGTSESPLVSTYRALSPSDRWQEGRKYGWLARPPDTSWRETPDALRADLVTSEQPRTLRVTVPPGVHRLRLLTGDSDAATESLVVSLSGRPITRLPHPLRPGEFRWLETTVDGGASGKQIDLTFSAPTGQWKLAAVRLE